MDITFVGGSQNGPTEVNGVAFPRDHEGHSGWTVEEIDDIVPSPALNVDPHIILLHIGTNDVFAGASSPDGLGELLDQIIENAPSALLVVSNLVPLAFSADALATYNSQVPLLVDERRAQGANIVFVDQYSDFPLDDLDDGVHPNAGGYDRMAGVWYNAIYEHLVDVD